MLAELPVAALRLPPALAGDLERLGLRRIADLYPLPRAALARRFGLLPGDRLVESDIASALRVSWVPVREALRLLESQGIVVNTPYRGMRLMAIDGFVLDLPDSPDNARVFGRPSSGRAPGAFPQARVLALEHLVEVRAPCRHVPHT